jgi:DNA-directed RNA polymerase beta' subunit
MATGKKRGMNPNVYMGHMPNLRSGVGNAIHHAIRTYENGKKYSEYVKAIERMKADDQVLNSILDD